MQKRQFTPEFKREAVRLFREADKPATDVARELGIPRSRLYQWSHDLAHSGDAAFAGSGRRQDPTDELSKLRRENARLQEEVSILKKAAAYFAKELK